MEVRATKAQAASRQLDMAIALLLTDEDPLAVRTLAAAAHSVLSDLVEHRRPGDSWKNKLISDSGVSRAEALKILNGASNFLKHADKDPEAELSFEEEENDHLIFFATLECGELGENLTVAMQAFQIWYLAAYPDNLDPTLDPVKKAIFILPGLPSLKRQARLRRGAQFLEQAHERYGSVMSDGSVE